MRARSLWIGLVLICFTLAGMNCPPPTGGTPGGGNETCTEDASTSVMVIITPESTTTRTSTCVNVKPELESKLATVSFMNTHPTRKVAIAAILIRQSDKQFSALGPCTFSIQQGGAFSDLESCHDGIAEGCSSPAGLFIEPGQTTTPWLFQCKREELFPGSGACGAMQLETITWSVLAHAVFCDDFDTAQANFCAIAHPRLLDDGLPVNNNWVPITSTDCP
jgi:hypothetical protein